MKKSFTVFLIALTAVLLVVSFAACSVKITTDEIWNLATYKTGSGEKGRDVYIKVSRGGTVFYEYETKNGVEQDKQNPEEFEAPAFVLDGNVSLSLSGDYLANEKTSFEDDITTYTADIKNTKAVLDIDGAQNAKITIKVNSKDKKLISTQIEYVTPSGNSVLVLVTPYYG